MFHIYQNFWKLFRKEQLFQQLLQFFWKYIFILMFFTNMNHALISSIFFFIFIYIISIKTSWLWLLVTELIVFLILFIDIIFKGSAENWLKIFNFIFLIASNKPISFFLSKYLPLLILALLRILILILYIFKRLTINSSIMFCIFTFF